MDGRQFRELIGYQSLLDPQSALAECALTDLPAVDDDVELGVKGIVFQRDAYRSPERVDRTSFMRKGTAGNWRSRFTADSGEVFDHCTGEILVDAEHAKDRSWYRKPIS